MLTRRRILLVILLLMAAAVAWSVWIAVQTARDLRSAQAEVERIRTAVTAGDTGTREAAVSDLQLAASSARDRTDGFWWGAMTLVPFVGDDAAGVRELSTSLDLVAAEAIAPLSDTIDDLDSVVEDGRIDVDKVTALQPQVTNARAAFSEAAAMVGSRDSSGFAGAFRSRYDEYVDAVSDLARDLGSAETAVELVPEMAGGTAKRRYLLIFENNAEIRATGGLPGSWAVITADDGKLEMGAQGSASSFEVQNPPIGDLTSEEVALFGPEMGRFFQDPNFTPDFPRAAEVFNAFWTKAFPAEPIDGVISIDVVGLSYLMQGIGPVQVADLTVTADNVVDELLSKIYLNPDTAEQDETFRQVARTVFRALTADVADPLALVEGIAKATNEGRFRVASFVAADQEILNGTRVAGNLSSSDGATPHVDIALNDATASKMSYYLRYNSEVQSRSCVAGVQKLTASLTLSQSIAPADARALPPYVTGGGFAGVDPGEQFVRAHVFAPFEGSISGVKISGEAVTQPEIVTITGRPAFTLSILLKSAEDVVVSFEMMTGTGQTAPVVVTETPSVVPGENVRSFASAC